MVQFNFETIKETEKAVYAKVPYFEATSDAVKKHKQLYYECWIPKSIVTKGAAREFVIAKRNEVRLSNPYQKRCSMPSSWATMGQYAPEKVSKQIEVIDDAGLKDLISYYQQKYGASLSRLIIDGEGDNGAVSKEDERILPQLEFPALNKPSVPKKKITIYQ
jgi:hypothetical protein